MADIGADTVTLAFHNRDATSDHEIVIARPHAHLVADWYGGYHAGDDYDVLVDGAIVAKDVNGEIEPLA